MSFLMHVFFLKIKFSENKKIVNNVNNVLRIKNVNEDFYICNHKFHLICIKPTRRRDVLQHMTIVYQKHVSTQHVGLWTTEIIWVITTQTNFAFYCKLKH